MSAFEFVKQNHESAYEPELWRTQGRLYKMMPNKRDESIKCYWQSISLAKKSGARTFELAALTDLLAISEDQEKDKLITRIQNLIIELQCQEQIPLISKVKNNILSL